MTTGTLNEAPVGRRFILVRTLGEGTFGSVYLADMVSTGGFKRRVALKLLNTNWDPASDAGRRLRDEARLLGRLQHRNIVRVDDLVQVDGRWALLMEYIAGVSLEQLFETAAESGGKLPVAAVLEMCAAIAVALDAAWNATGDDGVPLRVVHRDIKPSNVLLSDLGDVKVLDFGVARAEFVGREAKTERVRYGSIGYMAPERMLGEPETSAGDVYALAVVVCEMVTLTAFGRAELGPDAQERQVARAVAALAAELGPDHAELVEMVRRGLVYEPEKRPSADELHRALRLAIRRASGDDLVTFARAFVPAAIATREKDPVEGTELVEGVTRTTEMPRTTFESSGGTIVAAEPAVPPSRTGPRSLGPMLIIAGVAVMGVLGLGLVGVWALTHSPDTPIVPVSSAPPAAVAVEPAPAPAPVVVGTQVASAAPAEVVVPASAPAPTPTRQSSPPAPAPAGTGTGGGGVSPVPTPAPGASPPPAPETSAPPADVRVLRAAKFTLAGGTGLRVRCGSVSQSGDVSVLLKEFPAGTCTVGTDGGLSTTVKVDAPRGVSCMVEGGALSCS